MGAVFSRQKPAIAAIMEPTTKKRPLPTTDDKTDLVGGSNEIVAKRQKTNPRHASQPRRDEEKNVPNASMFKFDETIDATPDGTLYRFCVTSGPLYWLRRKDIIKQLNKLLLPPYTGLNKVSKKDHFFVTFPNKECAEQAKEKLSNHLFKNQSWQVRQILDQPLKRQRFERSVNDSQNNEKLRQLSAADKTAQWRNIEYNEQIDKKREKLENALREVTKNIRKELKHIDSLTWLVDIIKEHKQYAVDGADKKRPMCCPLKDIILAEDTLSVRHYYRNKNELTVGPTIPSTSASNAANDGIAIGYMLGNMREGQFFVGPVDQDCKTTSKVAIDVASTLCNLFKHSKLKAYDCLSHQGYWRQVVVRETHGEKNKQVIVIVSVNHESIQSSTSELTEEQKLKNEKDTECRYAVVSALHSLFHNRKPKIENFGVYWQPTLDYSLSSETPVEHIHGIENMKEVLHIDHSNNGTKEMLKFRIQPTSFFQVNIAMTEKLYKLIGEIAKIDKNTVILDVCCGTGSIGLSLASLAHSVVGIELNESAVRDARYNATLNNIKNATFIAGRAEKCINQAIKLVTPGKKCVVILDPPRAGVANNVIGSIRAMASVDRIVYVACEADNFWKNALAFCRPTSKLFRLEPFRPKVAYGVDLFPHTKHVEMAVLLERTEIGKTYEARRSNGPRVDKREELNREIDVSNRSNDEHAEI